MPVSHARVTALTSTDEKVPGLPGVLARVRDPRKMRGRRFSLVFALAVAVICVLAGAKSFREIGDQAADVPQELLAALGGRPHPLRRRIIAPSEKRIRTLLHVLDAEALDQVIGDWLRALAAAGRLEGLLTAIAIDGKWLRGMADGQVKLFAAMLHQEKVIIAQHRIPDDTNEITQVEELLDPVDLTDAVVTADAAHAQHDTAGYIGGKRKADYLLTVKGNQPACRPPSSPRSPPRAAPARITSPWTTGTAASSSAPSGSPVPTASSSRTPPRCCGSAATPTAWTAPPWPGRSCTASPRWTPAAALPPSWPGSPKGSGASSQFTGTAYGEDGNTGYAGNGPQVMAALRNLVISLLHLAGITQITRTLQSICRDRTRALKVLPL